MTFTLAVTDVDELPTAMTIDAEALSIAEGVTVARKLATVSFSDDARGTNTSTVPKNDLFEVKNGNELWLIGGVALDYETPADRSHIITLTGTGGHQARFTLTVTDVDETAGRHELERLRHHWLKAFRKAASWPISASPTMGRGANTARISTNDWMEIRNGNELWLKDGAELISEAQKNPVHTVTLTGPGGHRADFRLTVEDANDVLPVFTSGDTAKATEN